MALTLHTGHTIAYWPTIVRLSRNPGYFPSSLKTFWEPIIAKTTSSAPTNYPWLSENGRFLCIHFMTFFFLPLGTEGFVYRMCLGLEQGYSYLAPLYWRHKYEGRVTNHLMFPLYSCIIRNHVLRQPIGGEFAFNRRTLVRFTDPEKWHKG